MSIRVACICGKQYNLKDEFAGRRAKCPACGAVIAVPQSGHIPETAPPQAEKPQAVHPTCEQPLSGQSQGAQETDPSGRHIPVATPPDGALALPQASIQAGISVRPPNTVTLPTNRDIFEKTVPRVCMRCGHPIDRFVEESLRKSLIAPSTIRALLPLCPRHRSHLQFSWLLRVLWVSGIISMSFVGVALVIVALMTRKTDEIMILAGLICLLLLWAFGVRPLIRRMVFPTTFKNESITFSGVSEGFIKACLQPQAIPRADRVEIAKGLEVSYGIVSFVLAVLAAGMHIYCEAAFAHSHRTPVLIILAPLLSLVGTATGMSALWNAKRDRPILGAIGLLIGVLILARFLFLVMK
jgi:hypothetical protein